MKFLEVTTEIRGMATAMAIACQPVSLQFSENKGQLEHLERELMNLER